MNLRRCTIEKNRRSGCSLGDAHKSHYTASLGWSELQRWREDEVSIIRANRVHIQLAQSAACLMYQTLQQPLYSGARHENADDSMS